MSVRVTGLSAVVALIIASSAASAAFARGTDGVVTGGGYYRSAIVCIDTNNNARCDRDEPHDLTNRSGGFSFRWAGPVVAEIVPGLTTFYDPKTGDTTPVREALTFRAPIGATDTVSAVSTELLALMDSGDSDFRQALNKLAARVGVPAGRLLEDFTNESNPAIHDALGNETQLTTLRVADAVDDASKHGSLVAALRNRLALDDIRTLVVIYAENHSFDNLFGFFPGANGLKTPKARSIRQVDRNGSTVFETLPPAWGGLTAAGQPIVVSQAQTTDVWPNAPFQIDTPHASTLYGYSAVSIPSSRAICITASSRTSCRSMAARAISTSPGQTPADWSWVTSTVAAPASGISRSVTRWPTIFSRRRTAAHS